ncbi:hypothetical protein [Paraburkholderia sp. Cpub6]|uniref:hypothetical protein n=1 Tax=Paraburkholderia sp. Cpub6 TaxID=2723094 RepID=UPI00161C4FBD|nr:hypothetical protein [Paraburkholderia sp. Cpub6]MBB5461046.1 hypothetical protein [Paraburkholderia sp. Cpub6]
MCSALISPTLLAASTDSATPQGAATPQSPDTAAFDKSLAEFNELMRTMQSQMNEIRQTQDPQARQNLLQKHWATMQSAMATMRGVWGPGMMGYGGMHRGMTGPGMMGGGWGHMGGYYSRLTPEQLRQRQYMTDQYLLMQEEMMNNMMWQQQYWMAPPTSPR